MKIKLKQGVLPSDIPRASGQHKKIMSAFMNGKKEFEVDFIPKNLNSYIEPVAKEKVVQKKESK
tara:strand:- start:58 stop:249 length:192 start_codon:yes stop_codon:yes gene_type:complete